MICLFISIDEAAVLKRDALNNNGYPLCWVCSPLRLKTIRSHYCENQLWNWAWTFRKLKYCHKVNNLFYPSVAFSILSNIFLSWNYQIVSTSFACSLSFSFQYFLSLALSFPKLFSPPRALFYFTFLSLFPFSTHPCSLLSDFLLKHLNLNLLH